MIKHVITGGDCHAGGDLCDGFHRNRTELAAGDGGIYEGVGDEAGEMGGDGDRMGDDWGDRMGDDWGDRMGDDWGDR